MAVYLTKTWGFSNPTGPLQFSTNGWRERAREMLVDGDLVVIVGTQAEPTVDPERGRILGLMQPTTVPASSLGYALQRSPGDLNKAGEYKWPFALEITAAWRFNEPRPLLADVLDRTFHMDAAQGIVALNVEEAGRILALPRTPTELLAPVSARARTLGAEAARKQSAPVPTTVRSGIMHMRRAAAYTYAMELVGASRPAFKIGWAFDWKARQRLFNQYALPELGGITYKIKLTHLFATAMAAFKMEQFLLTTFRTARQRSNHEVICTVDSQSLERAWVDYLANAMRGPQAARSSTPTPSARKASR